MKIVRSEPFEKFVKIWSFLTKSVSLKRSKIHHISGIVIQPFPVLMLQKMSDSVIKNSEALNIRLNLWINGDFAPLLHDTRETQKKMIKLKATTTKMKNLTEIGQFVAAIERGDINILNRF